MNLTVGPLPPAVYWRRRALVLGGVLLIVILIVSMCDSAGGAGKNNPAASHSTSPAPVIIGPSGGDPSAAASGDDGGSGDGADSSGAGGAGGTASPSGSAAPGPTASVDPSVCTDAEMKLTPSIAPVTGGDYPYQLNLRIRNVSTRTCKRDVGYLPQEMHITDSAGHTLWSSDNCQSTGTSGGHDVRTFKPNIEASFTLPWNGDSNQAGCTKGSALLAGSYRLVAKLGSKVSDPVSFTIDAAPAVGS